MGVLAVSRCALLGFLAALLPVEGAAIAGECVIVIDTTADGDDGECTADCTLREAIAVAPAGCILQLPSGTYELTLGTLVFDETLSVIGAGSDEVTIDGSTVLDGFAIDAGGSSGAVDLHLAREELLSSPPHGNHPSHLWSEPQGDLDEAQPGTGRPLCGRWILEGRQGPGRSR